MPTARLPIDLAWSGASGSPGVNVFHARADSIDHVNADFDALAEILHDFYDAIKGIFPTTMTIRNLGVSAGVGDDAGEEYSTTPWTVTGTGTGDYAPPACAILVSWRTSSGGRQGRGRTFLGPVTEGLNESNGTPDEPARTLVGDAAQDLIDSSSSFGNGALGVYSRVGDTFRDFTSAVVPNYFAVLRSRRD